MNSKTAHSPHSVHSILGALIINVFILTACQLTPTPGTNIPPIEVPTAPSPHSPTPPAPTIPPVAAPVNSGKSCKSSDPDFQCMALKVVSYEDSQMPSVLSEAKALELVDQMNAVWSPCKIGFQMESYLSINPITVGLDFHPNWRTQSTQVRSTFSDSQSFLVVATGSFSSATIAVTQMPGYAPFGTLVEEQYADNPLTVGHELGHYMGLYHLRNSTNLMNPYIGPHTENLTASQCEIARSTNRSNWVHMMR